MTPKPQQEAMDFADRLTPAQAAANSAGCYELACEVAGHLHDRARAAGTEGEGGA